MRRALMTTGSGTDRALRDCGIHVPHLIIRVQCEPVGPELPAVFTGVVKGNLLTLSVAVDDTVEKKLVPLGPVTVVFGREPRMQTCPICRSIAKPQMVHPLTVLLRPAT